MENLERKSLLLTIQKFDYDGYIIDALLAIIVAILTHHGQMKNDQMV